MRIKMHAVAALSLASAVHITASAAEPSCYPPDIPAPPIRLQTVIVIDSTTDIVAAVTGEFRAAALAAAAQSGQRLVVLTFAGLAAGENLTKVLDIGVEDFITDASVRANARISAFKRSQLCVKDRAQAAASTLDAVLHRVLRPPGHLMMRSEIVYALRDTLGSFARPGLSTRVFVYSDGVQNGSGQVFYERGQPRCIDVETELQRLRRNGQSAPLREPVGASKVLWWGILMNAPDATERVRRYYSADCVDAYRRFWHAALRGWSVDEANVGAPSLPNANLMYVPFAAKRVATR